MHHDGNVEDTYLFLVRRVRVMRNSRKENPVAGWSCDDVLTR